MTNSTSARLSAVREALRIAATATLFAGLALMPSACRKGEKTAGGTAAQPEATTPGAPPVAAGPDLAPHIAAKADPGAGPFAGLAHARGIAVDSQGRVWIADFGHAAVKVFDANGALFGGWGGIGETPYGMKDPCGIAVHGDNVYVADTWRTGVERFSTSGELRGKAAADLYGPHGVAVAPDGHVYISDAGNNRIVVCDADLSNPKPIGKAGAGPEEFSSPVGIAVSPSGTVYVADASNKRIQVIDPQGRFKAHWKINGWGANAEPYLDVDSDETVYVSDPNGEAVLRLDRTGRETKRWTADDDGQKFLRPTGVAVDRKNRILYVLNTDADTVVRIKLGK